MNRRGFLTSAGAAVATGALISTPRKSYGQGSSSSGNICAASTAAATQAQANYFANAASANDWQTLSSTLAILQSSWTSQGMDAALNPAYQSLNASMVVSGSLPIAPLVASMQQYQPTVTADQVQSVLDPLFNQPASSIQGIISGIQSGGMASYINLASKQALAVARSIANPVSPPTTPVPVPSRYWKGYQGHLKAAAYRPQGACWNVGAAAFLAGTAFLVIGVMSGGVAPVLVAAAWEGIAFWGGIGAGALSAGQFIAC